MARRNLNDLLALVTVAREGSFTRAGAVLGVSQSALSQAIRALEERLEIRLLTRTTRSVSPTPAGERLLQAIGNRFDEIEAELDALTELRDKPAGSVRLTSGDHVLRTILLPKLLPVMHRYPDIHIEFDVSYGLRDIVADRFDAGVRLGESIDRDMIAVRIGPDWRLVAVASPEYFAHHPVPTAPQDLVDHDCINMRQATFGGLYAWEFARDGRDLRVRVEGQLTFNSSIPMIEAAIRGCGIAYVPENLVSHHITSGRLRLVLDDWSQPFAGYHLYYPSRRQLSPAMAVVVEALRHRI